LNPVYFEEWGRVVSVKDCIKSCFGNIERKACRRIDQRGSATIVLPPLVTTPTVVEYISTLFLELYNQERYIEVCFDTEKSNKCDILVEWVPISLSRPDDAIPVGWADDEEEYTWQDVVTNGHHYPSSSTAVWPPLEYQLKAQQEKIKNLQKHRQGCRKQ